MVNQKYTRRQVLKTASLTVGACAASSVYSFNVFAKSGKPVKLGMINPKTGNFAAIGKSDIQGAQLAVDHINNSGGILGRPAHLLVEDSAGKAGNGAQKADKLIKSDNVDFLLGTTSSAVAQSVAQTAYANHKLFMVSSAHADSITGKNCEWNIFRTCTSAHMVSASISKLLYHKFGGKWYFITPDYAYGHSAQTSFASLLQKLGGEVVGNNLVPSGTTDFSSALIKAKSANPDVLMVLPTGNSQVACLKQAAQFGINKQIAIAGGLMDFETAVSLPDNARYGWWVFEWYWKQPQVAGVKAFVSQYQKKFGSIPSARSWFGFASAHALALAANKAQSLNSVEVSRALEGMQLPAKVALQPNNVFFRKSDHQLMSSEYPGQLINAKNNKDIFNVSKVVPGKDVALAASEEQCKIKYPTT